MHYKITILTAVDSQFRTEHARDVYYDYYENAVPQSKEVINYLPQAYSVTVGVNVKVSAGKTINV